MRAGCFALFVLLVSRDCLVALPHDVTGLSAVDDCGMSWSYSLTIFLCPSACTKQIVSPDQKFILSGIEQYFGFNHMPYQKFILSGFEPYFGFNHMPYQKFILSGFEPYFGFNHMPYQKFILSGIEQYFGFNHMPYQMFVLSGFETFLALIIFFKLALKQCILLMKGGWKNKMHSNVSLCVTWRHHNMVFDFRQFVGTNTDDFFFSLI